MDKSALIPISPPSASISQTRCPFAVPPMLGLQARKPMLSRFNVSNKVFSPILDVASALSHPACPDPTTITS